MLLFYFYFNFLYHMLTWLANTWSHQQRYHVHLCFRGETLFFVFHASTSSLPLSVLFCLVSYTDWVKGIDLKKRLFYSFICFTFLNGKQCRTTLGRFCMELWWDQNERNFQKQNNCIEKRKFMSAVVLEKQLNGEECRKTRQGKLGKIKGLVNNLVKQQETLGCFKDLVLSRGSIRRNSTVPN